LKKIYYLASCGTCKKIIDELELVENEFYLQDIKTEKITEAQLQEIINAVGSCEAIFSKVARKYRGLKLNEQTLNEAQMMAYILVEYTFLKRPVIQIDNLFFVCNAKATVEKVKKYMATLM
jgi:arsenate reductase (glutaredoxin)